MSFKNKLKVPDLCGAGSLFDEALGQFDTLQTEALNEINDAEIKLPKNINDIETYALKSMIREIIDVA